MGLRPTMVFTAPVFLFLFLPAVLLGQGILPRALRNPFLLLASLVFYAWGEGRYTTVVLGSVALNYGFGLALGARPASGGIFWLATVANLTLLGVFKYANFLIDNLNVALAAFGIATIALAPIHLPIGISFFTFHCLSYLWDLRRTKVPAQRSAIDFALYVLLFPQLVAGPIVRYHEICDQLAIRNVDWDAFALGVRRFVVGLAKKMLIANVLAVPADRVYAIPGDQLTAPLAWLGAAAYMLQIYFDFSGYSDMAVGLGRMLGFRFPENFAHPYAADSITEFWRRWHISLSNWFRDYVYIPLGGNRRGSAITYRNLLTVFFLCGLWHGASWTFVAWGLFHGAFLVAERAGLRAALGRLPRAVGHVYTVLVVLVGWVFFRADTFGHAFTVLGAMAGFGPHRSAEFHVDLLVDRLVLSAFVIGIATAMPVGQWLAGRWHTWRRRLDGPRRTLADLGGGAVLASGLGLLFWASAARVATSTYNPFIYFRF